MALGSTENLGPDSQVLTPLAWTGSTWATSANAAVNTPSLGSELAVNGTFAADSDWTKGSGWTIGSGTANASTASADLTAAVNPLTTGKWYQVTYTVSAFSAGTVLVSIGGQAGPARASNATFTETRKAGSAVFKFTGAGFTGSLDNVSIKEITLADLFASLSSSTADVLSDIGVTGPTATSGLQAGLVLNLDSAVTPANFIICYLSGTGNCILDECVAGTYTNKINTAVTYSAGAVLRVVRDGTSCRVFYNNAAVSTVQTMAANVNTLMGMLSTSASNSLDGYALWPRGTGNQFSGLDQY